MTAQPRHRLRILLNRNGGTIARLGPEDVRQRLERAFAGHGVEAQVELLTGPEIQPHAEQAVRDAQGGRIDGVGVGGGDGSVSTVAGALAHTGVPMAVLPLGTLNHFARDLGMPADLEEAVGVISQWHRQEVDAAEVNGQIFVNNSLIGMYPYMVIDRERRRELHGLSKWPAMFMAFLRMLARFPRRRLVVCVEGRETPYRTPCLVVGVNEYSFDMFRVERQQGMQGGALWVFIAKQTGPLAFLLFALRAAFLGLEKAADYDVVRTTSLEIRLKAHRVPVSRDGEVDRMRAPLAYRIHAGALQVLAKPAP